MARATFVKSANKNIYRFGKMVDYVSKKGKQSGMTLRKLDRTIPADEDDEIFIAKGESYYWWQFKNGGKHFSKTEPKPSQLTQSSYLSQLYSIQERINEFETSNVEDLENFVDELKGDLETLRDDTSDSLDNMPENLKTSPTGELLQERIDNLENAISEFENIDTSYDEPDEDDLKKEIAGEEGIDDSEDDWEELITEEMLQLKREDKIREFIDEKLQEIQGISLEG
jgi:hypothetical protein